MLSGIDEKKFSKTDRKITVKSFLWATINDMYEYIKPLLKKCPDNIILHLETNNKVNESPKVVLGVCECLCSSTCWFLSAARHLWYTWEVPINDLLLWVFSGCFCQVLSSLFLNLSYITPKNENSSRSFTGEKTIW